MFFSWRHSSSPVDSLTRLNCQTSMPLSEWCPFCSLNFSSFFRFTSSVLVCQTSTWWQRIKWIRTILLLTDRVKASSLQCTWLEATSSWSRSFTRCFRNSDSKWPRLHWGWQKMERDDQNYQPSFHSLITPLMIVKSAQESLFCLRSRRDDLG